MSSASLAQRALKIRLAVEQACARAGRDPGEVRVVAVSKRQSVEAIREAAALGFVDFGENYPQELITKAAELRDLPQIRWHMIGHLQTNKVTKLLPDISCLHSVDSMRLLEKVDSNARALGTVLPIFIAVNLGMEEQKHGCAEDELASLIAAARTAAALDLQGLMAIPPAADDPEKTRAFFRTLKALNSDYGLPRLSMGMSGDFAVAIEEGATDVRIGTALFGGRS